MSDTLASHADLRSRKFSLRADTDGQQAPGSTWRMLIFVRPHRVRMAIGVLLGLGVAITYAASLSGILPILKVLVENENLHTWLRKTALEADSWYTGTMLSIANLFPAEVTAEARMQTLLMLIGALVGINILGNFLRVFSQYFVLYAAHRSIMDLRRQLYRKALHAPLVELSSDVSSRVSHFMTDVREVFIGITTLFGRVAREPLKAICVLTLALYIDARLTIVALLITPIAVGLLWYFGRKIRKATTRLLRGYGLMLGALEESLQGLDVVKGYGREGHERRRMWALERRMFKQQLKIVWVEAINSPLIEVFGVLIGSVAIVWLASRTFSGEISPSQFMTTVVLLSAMLDPVRKMANVYNKVQRASAAASRLFVFLDRPDEHSPTNAQYLTGRGPHEVRYENVKFHYNPDQAPALDDVSLTISPGECIAIVGPNGSGKSTLMKMLPHLIQPEAGHITIDGIDVARLSLRNLREHITLVSQRAVIFARSAHDNIAYGKSHTTPEEVRDAARQAHADDFIEKLPEGYDTVLGDFGTSISGGQRQRIAIARAFLKPASILIFDEATSEIDAESERLIHDALEELRKGKTTFLIAHRHTVMDLADRIVVMDVGRIIDVGTHDELIARCPLYVSLYRVPTSAS